jgi:glycosyltransferase involved in cell wall biosynthesis
MRGLDWRGLRSKLLRRPPFDITLIGYPLRATGRGEHLRSIFRALRSVGLEPKVVNLDSQLDEIEDDAVRASLVSDVSVGGIRLFHCNGDEADAAAAAIDQIGPGRFRSGYNVIHPAWELPRYPARWAHALDRYDEVWAPTKFVRDSLSACVTQPLHHVPDACQPQITAPLTRRDFGFAEDDYLVLSFFDYWSYVARKNPLATIEAFKAAAAARPGKRLRLVMKTSHGAGTLAADEVRAAIAALGESAITIDRTMGDNEIKNLIAVCDCLLSMHRSEGFGRGPAEAMFLGKPVIATGWSGNMDYMTSRTSFPVGYRLIPVKEGEYIEGDGQEWADPDPAQATQALIALVDDPALGPRIGERAARHMRRSYGDQVLGKVYRKRFEEIARMREA